MRDVSKAKAVKMKAPTFSKISNIKSESLKYYFRGFAVLTIKYTSID